MPGASPNRQPRRPADGRSLFKSRLASIKRSHHFIPWGQSAAFARELSTLLTDLESTTPDPRQACDLIAAFYRADKSTIGRCDDSIGHVGDVFRLHAAGLFAASASRCPDREWLADLVFDLNRDDDFGVRDRA